MHDTGVGECIEAVDPLFYLVDEVDIPLVGPHAKEYSESYTRTPLLAMGGSWRGGRAGPHRRPDHRAQTSRRMSPYAR
ncbi:hypothetical protein Misp04_27830 [Micromonospora sp. NBRC 101691]|nr:hypothetical protein Misp04_27830 [Micromonospora sp. NBRC 101691]